MSYGDIAWMEDLEFFFIEDGDVTTVVGLAHGKKRHVDARDTVTQGCFRREGQRQVSSGDSSHGDSVRGGDYDAVGGQPFMKEVERLIS